LSSNKSFSSETSERYALALFELAKESSELDKIQESVKELLDLLNTNESFKDFVNNPTQSQNVQLSVIENISSKMLFVKNFQKFLAILILKRRIFFLEKILKSFLSLTSKKRGELHATLISSKNLSEQELKELNMELAKTVGSQITFNFKVDENLIGGLKFQVGSLMIDTSIRNRLKKYEQKMLEA
tara:strand:+ start:296 stop:853 length:558 start_codon:yes stop_codon:yes gene_type:complete